MPRANRYYQEGYVYHITHRCNHKKFLLAYKRDKKRYRQWLFEAVKRYKLPILNYIITDNHIHLLVVDTGEDRIANTMRLVASRTSFDYQRRKKLENGAFWQGRYFATAIQSGSYLWQCMIYIDLNMVRCGVVSHPLEWEHSGYYEWINPRQRYKILNEQYLCELFEVPNRQAFIDEYQFLVESKIQQGSLKREKQWTEQVAVGDERFLREIKNYQFINHLRFA